MMWSEETERLRERYHVLYGVTQGLGAASILAWVLAWDAAPSRVGWGLIVATWGTGFVWRRWGWRPYQRAYRADLDAWTAEAQRTAMCPHLLSRPRVTEDH